MYAVETDPFLWVLEFLLCQAVVLLLQLLGAVLTIVTAHSTTLSLSNKYALVLSLLSLLCYVSSRIFDSNTHLIGAVLTGLTMAFIAPLQSSSYLYMHHNDPKQHTRPLFQSILEIVIPAATPSPPKHPSIPARAHLRAGVCFIVLTVIYKYYITFLMFHTPPFPSLLISASAVLFVYLGANGVLHITSYLRHSLGGLSSPTPFFGFPLFAMSQQQFWAVQWNMPVSHALRSGVARPLTKICKFHKALAVLMCFFVSGVSHELILRFADIGDTSAEWLIYFVLCGVGTIVETYVSKRWHVDDSKWKRIVRRVLGIVYTFSLFHFFFVPVTIRSGLVFKAIDAYGSGEIVIKALYSYITGLGSRGNVSLP